MKKLNILLIVLLVSKLAFGQFTSEEILYLKGCRHYEKGNIILCKEMMDAYIDAAGDKIDEHFFPYVYIGTYYYTMQDYEKSLNAFLKDLEFDESRSTYSVAALYALLGDRENALLWLEKNQKTLDAYPRQMLAQDPDWSGLAENKEFLELIGRDLRVPYKVYIDSCDYYANAGDLDMALQMIEEAIKIDPTNVKGYHGRGSLYLSKGEYDKAIAAFKKENEIEEAADYKSTKRYLGYQLMGVTCSYKKDFQGVIDNLTKAINGNKTLYGSYLDLAAHLMGVDDFYEAKRAVMEYLLIAEDDDFGQYMAGLAYLNLGELDASKEHTQKAIDLLKESGTEVPQEYYDLLGN